MLHGIDIQNQPLPFSYYTSISHLSVQPHLACGDILLSISAYKPQYTKGTQPFTAICSESQPHYPKTYYIALQSRRNKRLWASKN